ncbi:AT-hook motif nuclear-localized protein 10 [Senna tora]|uniref:AT-hook motif nuclear-localized protein n=1 Tax=Senna tora TaxID=362788 RepID=A0A834WQ89_9FABA|nr:AT-hook motif nuclear-localized protein 10 [Senna tora]
MSGSETGLMTSSELFNMGLPKSPAPSQPVLQNIHLGYSVDGRTAEFKQLAPASPLTFLSSGSNAVSGTDGGEAPGFNFNTGSEPLKRKRGRPRKYGPDGSMPLGSAFKLPIMAVNQCSEGSALPTSLKKVRGRPTGSSKKQHLELLGSAGVGFTPHVITVKAGEGRFEILSLSGSFLLSENRNQRSRTGGLRVSLSGPDGRVLGGGVAGLLTAASPVQAVVESFIADGGKESKSASQMEVLSASQNLPPARHHGVLIVNRQVDLGAHLTRVQEPAITTVIFKAFHDLVVSVDPESDYISDDFIIWKERKREIKGAFLHDVRIVFLLVDSAISNYKRKCIVHQTPIAPIVEAPVTINQLLLRKRR